MYYTKSLMLPSLIFICNCFYEWNAKYELFLETAERRKAVIHAIKNAETESLLAYIRLLCSKLTDEQLKTPETEFFKENFPNLLLLRNKRYPLFELKRKDDGDGTEMVCFSALMKQIEENMENATKLNDWGLRYHCPNFKVFLTEEFRLPYLLLGILC